MPVWLKCALCNLFSPTQNSNAPFKEGLLRSILLLLLPAAMPQAGRQHWLFNHRSSRPTSPSPSETTLPYRTIASRIATFPATWNRDSLSPKQLATCGFVYLKTTYLEKKCVYHVCQEFIEAKYLGVLHNNDILNLHGAECLLADTLSLTLLLASYKLWPVRTNK